MAAARLLISVFFLLMTAAAATHSATSPLLLSQILSHLGFHELSLAATHSLPISPFPAIAATPTTIFAPSDTALASCSASFCSPPLLLPLHSVPFLLSSSDLRLLPFSTNLQTLNPLHCLSVASTSMVLVNGVPISHPDLFNDGLTVVHGLDSVLPPTLCSAKSPSAVASTNFNFSLDIPLPRFLPPRLLMSFMLHDAIFRLRHGGYGVLSLAIKVRFNDLLSLTNVTLFAVDDSTIFNSEDNESPGSDRDFAGNVRLHVLPNRYVGKDELRSLPVGTTMRTLKEGQDLMVTSAGGLSGDVEINYARVKTPEVVRNLKVMVHALTLPFAKVRVEPGGQSPETGGPAENRTVAVNGPPGAQESKANCGPGHGATVEVEDYHGP
ncbi:hypothetical protein MLD38_028274 [Melastoma candidum]|uniref:Uncharacterized protein n=1 Tax=Melastoma candidum TaxID=119954 RepID=A0ACB9N0B6_9MYRT|nr:hypothetical protein MLD38_028274 [Melastoma candidum]